MNRLGALYDRFILPHPWIVLILFGAILALAALRFDQFRLDASAESLVLENDRSLEEYRQVNRIFTTSDDFLVVTYSPREDLFSETGLQRLAVLVRREVGETGPYRSLPPEDPRRTSLSRVVAPLPTPQPP